MIHKEPSPSEEKALDEMRKEDPKRLELADLLDDFYEDYDPYELEGFIPNYDEVSEQLKDSSYNFCLRKTFFEQLLDAPKTLLYNLQAIADELEKEQDEMLKSLYTRAKELGFELLDYIGLERDTVVTLDMTQDEHVRDFELPAAKPRLFVDMDGVLAKFNNQISSEEQLYEKGYFANLEPQQNVVNAIGEIVGKGEVDVYVLSAYLTDSEYALAEKNEWVDKYLPEIDKDHRVFMPCGHDKSKYIPFGIQKGDVLLDDYSKNLHEWPNPPAVAVKLLNGINGTRGTWEGDKITMNRPASEIADRISDVVLNGAHVKDRGFYEKEDGQFVSQNPMFKSDIVSETKDRHNAKFGNPKQNGPSKDQLNID